MMPIIIIYSIMVYMKMLVFPWPQWSSAQHRTYPYGFAGFAVLIVIAIIYLLTMWFVGLSFWKAYTKYKHKIEYKYFAMGILSVATFDTFHVIGDTLFYIVNDSRVPLTIGGIEIFYLPLATSLSVMGIFLLYAAIFTYAVRKLEETPTAMHYIFYALVILGIALGINPNNYWHMIPPPGVFDTKPVTGTILLIVGIIAVIKFYLSIKKTFAGSIEDVKLREKRLKFMITGIVLLLAIVFLMVPHGLLASIQADWATTAMLIVTITKLASLGISSMLIYIGVVWPDWANKYFG